MPESHPSDSGEVTKVAERPAEPVQTEPLPAPSRPPPPPPPPPPKPRAAGTLLGVAPPKVEITPESPLRLPVFVRSGTSVVDSEEPLPLPRMALPSRPLMFEADSAAPGGAERGGLVSWLAAMANLPVRIAGGEVALWMVLGPALLALLGLVALVAVALVGAASKPGATAAVASPSAAASLAMVPASAVPKPPAKPTLSALAELEGKPATSLRASELLKLADGRAEKAREAAKALRDKVEDKPALAKERAVQVELLHAVTDAETARDALAAMAMAEAPLGADLLYEVWTGTTARTDATELARALVYSSDVRPKASPSLAVALDLRVAEKCEDFKVILPKALKDGDRRSLHLLTKLTAKRGCGAKKADDCFACLRENADELTATINAVKSRRPPSYMAP